MVGDVLNVGRHAVQEMISSVRVAPRLALLRRRRSRLLLAKVRHESPGRTDRKTTSRIDVFSPGACEAY